MVWAVNKPRGGPNMEEEKKELQEQKPNAGDVSKAFGNDSKKEQPEVEKAEPKPDSEKKVVDPKQEIVPPVSAGDPQAEIPKDGKEQVKPVEGVKAPEVTQDPAQTQDLATGITVERLAQAELKAEMAINGVDPSKVARAVRLIDVTEVLDNGQYSEAKAKEAIETLMKEWPELKHSKSENNENQFYFGVPGQDEKQDKDNQKSMISDIFGN